MEELQSNEVKKNNHFFKGKTYILFLFNDVE